MMKKIGKYIWKSGDYMKDIINDIPKSKSWLATIFAAFIIALCFTGYLFWLIFVLAAFGCLAISGLTITFFSKCKEEEKAEKQCSGCCAGDGKSCHCKHDKTSENTEPDFKI